MNVTSDITQTGGKQAVVIMASRRHAIVSPDWHTQLTATVATKALETTIGDMVHLTERDNELVITSIEPRKSVLSRTYRGKEQTIVANLDRLFIVSALNPLYNTLVIDRIATVAASQAIPISLIVNKIDLGVHEAEILVERYAHSGIDVILTSAKFGQGIDLLREILAGSHVRIAAFAGVSGVGKSSILNCLVPSAEQKTSEVSVKTGQGRQTTSQPLGFLYERDDLPGILLIDLPGMQNFGVSHLSKEVVADTFPEIVAHRHECQFGDCAHLAEEQCAVKAAVESAMIPRSRYESYVHMIREIDQERRY